jgi:hypothetical protein
MLKSDKIDDLETTQRNLHMNKHAHLNITVETNIKGKSPRMISFLYFVPTYDIIFIFRLLKLRL